MTVHLRSASPRDLPQLTALLVAEVDGTVSGYASSSRYRSHPAFCATVESTVYLDHEARGPGLGASLYDELLDRLSDEPVHSVLAAVALRHRSAYTCPEAFVRSAPSPSTPAKVDS